MKKLVRSFLLSLVLAATAVSCSKEKSEYQVTVKLPAEFKADSLYLLDYKNEKIAGVTPDKDGNFVFKGKAAEAAPAGVSNDKLHLYIPFILENDNINIDIKDRDMNTDITGGKIQSIVYGYEKDANYAKLNIERRKVSKEQFTNLDMNDEAKVEEARKIVNKVGDQVYKIKNNYLKEVVANDNPPMAKAIASTMISDKDYTAEKILARLDKYKKEVGKSDYITYYEKMMNEFKTMGDNAKTVTVGSMYKNVSGKDRNGNEIKLADMVAKNKYTILEFWASWCGPCRGEIPNLKKAYIKYHGKGLDILSVSLDSKNDAWIKALDIEKTVWPNIILEGEFRNPQVAGYGISGIPASYLIDQNGKIVASNYELREFDLDRTLSKFIK
ncbi:redoxin domain-containing protein [Kaistella sp. G5-32]|uniref:Redoxin domain-containing protein n=1 Tax=Kaistella gelatinilytica TaxID=2787636 RepID=A0ABS0F7J5_9FLAO|nr:TlpA disulfide reductase family protein [Kaistella gelatinilytica]MBF8455682.1 redoxin domain-containing protein [Kaistella gelatinilytica]